jgi:hypothetical protein
MCNYKTWFYEDKIGYVIECKGCKKLQVGFGNVQLSFLKTDFDAFRKHVSIVQGKNRPAKQTGIKDIFIPTNHPGLTLLLNKQELGDLYNMLEHADTEIKTGQLMELFYKDEC